MTPLIDIKDLDIFYHSRKNRIYIVKALCFDIKKAEVFGLVGESGCGKSLTALSILKLHPPGIHSDGKILFQKNDSYIDILSLSTDELTGIRGKDIGMIFQEPMTSLNPVFTIGSQIAETIMTHEGISRREALNRSIELLKKVRIPEPEKVIKNYPHQLSGGMRQRVMIAIAISCNPALLIADEPTTALDVTIQADILELLKEIKGLYGMSILFITHDLSIIAERADRVAVMYAGRIVELTDTSRLFDNPLHPYTIGLIESLPLERGKKLKPIPGVVPSPEEFPPGCKFSNRCRYSSRECDMSEPSLSEMEREHLVRCIKAGQF